MEKDIFKIRWHGRGGQGAITAAKIVAVAGFQSGYPGIVMAPSFGTERRGAPVSTSLKISKSKIYDLSPIEDPDMVVVLDHLIIKEIDVTSGLKPGGTVVINTPLGLEDYESDRFTYAIADITTLAARAGLRKGIVNTGIIGSLAKAADFMNIDVLTNAIKEEFARLKPEENARAAELAYENTVIGGK